MSNITSLNQIGILWQKLKNKKKTQFKQTVNRCGPSFHFEILEGRQ